MKRSRAIAVAPFLAVLSLAAGGSAHAAATPPKEGTFKGSWSLSGTVQPTKLGSSTVTVGHLEGKVNLDSADGLEREFDGVCNSVSDQKTGGTGRCVWTDAAGDTLILELSGSILRPGGTVREARGTVIGGTGRYLGIEGKFQMNWLFVESTADDTRFTGHVTKLEGSWKRP